MDEPAGVKDATAAAAADATATRERGTLSFPTARFGEVTVAADTLLHFPHGMVGLPDAKRFVFLHDEGAPGPVFWMQSVDDPATAFLVCEPKPFFPAYRVELGAAEQALLGIRDESEGLVCVILVVPDDVRRITANLRGPVVINLETCIGMQLVLTGEGFPTKAPLFPQVEDGPAAAGSESGEEGGGACSS